MHDHTLSSSSESIEGQPREKDALPENPIARESKESAGLEDTQRLEDLQSFAKPLATATSSNDPFSDVYEEEAFHLFTTAPLMEPSRSKLTVPRHLMFVGAMVLFFVAMASPVALSGFNKAPVPASIADGLEPFKLHPEIAEYQEIAEHAETEAEHLPSDNVDPGAEVVFDSEELVTSTKRRVPRARPANRLGRPPVGASTPQTHETRPLASAQDDRHELGSMIDDVLVTRTPLEPDAPELPQAPTRAQVLGALRGVSAAVAQCGRDQGGRVTVDVTINGPSGRVSDVHVTDGADSAAVSCVNRAVRRAQFPRFADDDFRVRSFPFTVR